MIRVGAGILASGPRRTHARLCGAGWTIEVARARRTDGCDEVWMPSQFRSGQRASAAAAPGNGHAISHGGHSCEGFIPIGTHAGFSFGDARTFSETAGEASAKKKPINDARPSIRPTTIGTAVRINRAYARIIGNGKIVHMHDFSVTRLAGWPGFRQRSPRRLVQRVLHGRALRENEERTVQCLAALPSSAAPNRL
jgi:hypothetical protein